jgi:hypothetical protein
MKLKANFLVITAFTLQHLSGCQCALPNQWERFVLRKDRRLPVKPLTLMTLTGQGQGGELHCLLWCKTVSGCRSVNHQWSVAASSVTCEALGVQVQEVAGGTTPGAGWSFLQPGKDRKIFFLIL